MYWTMTKITNKKLLVALLPAIVVATVVTYLSIGSVHEANAAIQVQTMNVTKASFDVVENQAVFFSKGGRSAVTVEPVVGEIRLTRGVPTNVDLEIQHISSANPFPTINVKTLSPNGYIWYSPSLTSSTTYDQRVQAAETGKLIPGSIDLGTLVTFSNNSVDVQAGTTQVIHMTITLPKDIPDDAIGQGIYVPIPVQVVDSDGKSNTVFVQSHGVEVVIGG